MSTTDTGNITNKIEEKKNEVKGFAKSMGDIKGFATNLLSNTIFKIIVRVIVFGTMGLYVAKVAQSNILPDNINLSPYTNIQRNVETIVQDINVIKQRGFFGLGFWEDPIGVYSEKVAFDNSEFANSFDGSVLCILKNNAVPGSIVGNACLYFSKVLSDITSNTFWATNKLFNSYNTLPDWLIMLISGFYPTIFFAGFFIFNFFSGIIPHFKHMIQFFRKPNWSGTDWEEEGNIHFFRPIKWVFFWFLWFWISISSIFTMPIYLTIYNFIKPLTANYKSQDSEDSKHFGNFLLDNLLSKQTFILATFIYYLFTSTAKYLTPGYTTGIIFAVFILTIFGNMFNPSIENMKVSPGLANPKDLQAKYVAGMDGFNVCKNIGSISGGDGEYMSGGKNK
jgi:hypothetical protein